MLMKKLKNFSKVALADPIKDEVCKEYGMTRAELEQRKIEPGSDHLRAAMIRESAFMKREHGDMVYVNKLLAHEGNLIVPDVRRLYELEGLMAGARTVFMVRVDSPSVVRKQRGELSYQNHPTEVELDNYSDFDYIIENCGSEKHLEEQVDIIVDSIQDIMRRS
jgi:phosphomevalonate kinase